MLTSEVLGHGKLVAAVPAQHPLAAREMLDPGDFDGVDMISFQVDGVHQSAIRSFLDPARVRPRSRAVVRFADTAVAFAAEGLGIALVDSFTTMGPVGSGVVLKPLRDGPVFDLHAQWNPNRPVSAHLLKLQRIIAAMLSRTPPAPHALTA